MLPGPRQPVFCFRWARRRGHSGGAPPAAATRRRHQPRLPVACPGGQSKTQLRPAVSLNEDLGFSTATYGLGSGLFFIGYALFQVPGEAAALQFPGVVWLAGPAAALPRPCMSLAPSTPTAATTMHR